MYLIISATLANRAKTHGVHLELIEPGRPMQNGFIERFNCSYRQWVLDMYVVKNLQKVKELPELWMLVCNEQCPHESFNGMIPVEYRLFHQPQKL